MVIFKVQEGMVDEITSSMLLCNVPAKIGVTSLMRSASGIGAGKSLGAQKEIPFWCLLLRERKRRLSRHIASAVVYDSDLKTIPQSTQIALEGP
jgi:hypothetical protein